MGRPLANACLNGAIVPLREARISPLDRGFLFGDAVYEAMPAIGGEIVGLDRHIARLVRSLGEIGMPEIHSPEAWRRLLRQLVSANDSPDMILYLQVSRGPGAGRDHRFPEHAEPTVFAMALEHERPTEADYPAGIRASLRQDERWARCDIKSTSLLANVLARQAASLAGAEEAILQRDGWITEGAASTVIMINEGLLVAPPPDHSVLPSVTLDLVLELTGDAGLQVVRRPFRVEEMLEADEVMALASIREIVPVGQVDDHAIADGQGGPVWRHLFRLYQDRHPKGTMT